MRFLPESGLVALALLYAVVVLSAVGWAAGTPAHPSIGRIERLDPRFDRLIPPGAVLERASDGHAWTEGPLWDGRDGSLLFSDVPNNTVMR